MHDTQGERVNQKKDRDRLEEMETATLKNEENLGKRRQFWLPENETESLRCVKRRRRSRVASAAPVGCDESQNQSQSQKQQVDQVPAATTTKRSSRFRGVSRHRWTGRYEAHLWDKLSWNITQKKKGKQVYLGAYDDEESAARAYDLAALKYWGTSTFTNFPVSEYENEVKIMQPLTKEEYLASLRRKSSGFSRGVSKYRGVARHHHNGRWEARIGRVFGNKYLYLGTYGTQEEAARAYDIAAIEYRGNNAITNFDLSSYMRWLKPESDHENAEYEAQRAPEPENGTNYQQSLEFPSFSNDYSGSVYFNSNEKQDICQGSLNKSSSPTALSILLRSSMFRDLVEKNLHVSDDEAGEEEQKIPASEEDECERIIAELFMV